MTKYLIILSLLFVSCSQKEKTYEELEAEILCDVLPEIISTIEGGGPIYENNLNFEGNNLSNDVLSSVLIQIDSINNLIGDNNFSIGVIDTLFSVNPERIKTYFKKDFFYPLKKNLENRKIDFNEVNKCQLKIDFYSNDLSQLKIKAKENQNVYLISRVIIEKNKKMALVILSKSFHTNTILVHFKNNKWEIAKFLI